MKLLNQGEGTKTCGHHCVAMICDVQVEEVIAFIGHQNGTHVHEIIKALRHFGKNTSERLPFRDEAYLSKICVLNITWYAEGGKRIGGHYVVYNDGLLYDPAHCGIVEINNRIYRQQGKIVSHINTW